MAFTLLFLWFHAGLINCSYADPGVTTVGATVLPKKSQASPKAKTNQASKRELHLLL
jgi:hypothetical protein